MTPPRRRPTDPAGTPRRRHKIAGANRQRPKPPQGTPEPSLPDRDDPPVELTKPAPTAEPESATPVSGTSDPAPDAPEQESVRRYPSGDDPAPESPGVTPVDTDTDTDTDTDADAGADTGDGSPITRRSWKPVVAVGAATVVVGAFAVVAALQPGAPTNHAVIDRTATAQVTKAAADAIATLHSYDYRTVDEDFDRMRGVLAEELIPEFDESAEVTKQAVLQTHTSTETTITQAGALMLDDEHAEVLTYINVSASGDNVALGSAAAPIIARMEKVDGRWLVSEVRDR
ncbi:MAG: hypothetical protein GXY65_10090 [Rhodococcus sp.]|uniref:hypothetical protein n=1 Tax=Rhodococcus sp. TaxID=1831 RepID=UPI001690A20C|nr:hypothetical protein [Rhodococcus sp. (in: high G+C Gram-positive bacteria)]NLV79667.1 hypothetical protein [Rhodococcus sp. (in: high G+C Gram-positive bacteria)]